MTVTSSSVMTKRKSLSRSWVIWVVSGIFLSSLFLVPIISTLAGSFRSRTDLGRRPATFWPREFTLENWQRLFDPATGVVQSILNSAFISVGTVALTVVIAALAGYGFGRYRFAGKEVFFMVILAGMMIPFTVLLTPLTVVLRWMNLSNSLVGLVLVYTGFQLPFCIFIMRNAFGGIPRELDEAAYIDGCSRFDVFRRIHIPLVIPGLVTSGIYAFLNAWNEFMAALVLLSDQDKFTLPVMLQIRQIGQHGRVDWGLLDTGIVVAMIPCLLIFFLLQRYYINGILSGASK